MSGFECIGGVLILWPAVVKGLELYRAVKSGQGWELLCDEFKVEDTIYVEFVRHLLQSDTSEANLLQLTSREKPNQQLWKDPALSNSLRNRLGHKSEIVLKTLQEMDMLLTTLSEKLRSHEIAIETSTSKFRNAIRNVKIILPQANVKDILRKLHDHNWRLHRLLTSNANSGYNAQGRIPKSSPRLPQDVLRRISAQVNDLHDAIDEGYTCDCRNGHEANLGIHSPRDHDIIQPYEIVFPVDEDTAKQITQDDKESLSSPNDSSMESLDLDTQSIFTPRRWSHRGSLETNFTSIGSPSSPPFRGRSISVSKSSGIEDGGLIEDLCNFVRRLGERRDVRAPASCLGVLGVKEKKYTVQVTSLDGFTSEPLLSLDDYLSPPHNKEVTRQKRMDLALSLSLAILQFYKTPWIDMWWTWKNFCVLKGKKSQIFVTKRFYSSHSTLSLRTKTQTHSPSTSAFWECVGEPVLTRLGFALVELAMGKRLSELRQDQSSPTDDDDMLDLLTARSLVDSGRVWQESSQDYNEAVKACLTHQVFMNTGVQALNSEHPNFQLDVEKFVVAPLQNCYDASWGFIPKLEMWDNNS